MDTDQEDTRLAELREALRHAPLPDPDSKQRSFEIRAHDHIQPLSLDLLGSCDWSTVQLSPLTTDQISPLDLSTLTIGNGGTGSYTAPSWHFSDAIQTAPSSKISLTGEDADIEINGESVVSMLRDIRDRLAILQISEDMEAEWDDLRELRQQYEAKLAECREKSAAWKALKSG